jgi:hypothetical protein
MKTMLKLMAFGLIALVAISGSCTPQDTPDPILLDATIRFKLGSADIKIDMPSDWTMAFKVGEVDLNNMKNGKFYHLTWAGGESLGNKTNVVFTHNETGKIEVTIPRKAEIKQIRDGIYWFVIDGKAFVFRL